MCTATLVTSAINSRSNAVFPANQQMEKRAARLGGSCGQSLARPRCLGIATRHVLISCRSIVQKKEGLVSNEAVTLQTHHLNNELTAGN